MQSSEISETENTMPPKFKKKKFGGKFYIKSQATPHTNT